MVNKGNERFIEVAKDIELGYDVYRSLLQYMDDGEIGAYFENVSAQDVNGLRAILNSYLYLVHAAYSSLRKLEKATSGHRL